jgi:hypothetical protein
MRFGRARGPLEGLKTLVEPDEGPEALPTLGSLPDPLETPSPRDRGLEDTTGSRQGLKAQEALKAEQALEGEQGLREVYKQDLALERQLRRQNARRRIQ